MAGVLLQAGGQLQQLGGLQAIGQGEQGLHQRPAPGKGACFIK